MNCSTPDCALPVDEASLCFAHKAAAIADALCVVAAKRKALVVTVGGASVSMHPEAFLDEEIDAETPIEVEPPARKSAAIEHEPSVRETINGFDVTEHDLHPTADEEDA